VSVGLRSKMLVLVLFVYVGFALASAARVRQHHERQVLPVGFNTTAFDYVIVGGQSR